MQSEDSGLEKVHEVKIGSVSIEIYKRVDPQGRFFYDYRASRVFTKRDGSQHRTPYLQQRDFKDSIRAILDAMDWISVKNKANS